MKDLLSLELRVEYSDAGVAEKILRALEPDNEGYVQSRLEGSTIIFTMEAEDAGSMRATADDLLACLKIAESASGIVASGTDLDGDSLLE